MKRIVLFFSATGNSLYVARQLAQGDDSQALSIPSLVHSGKYDVEAEEIGIVMPLYGHMPPNMVREFLAKAHLKADYFFTIFTFGMRPGPVVAIWEEEAKQAGYHFDYINVIQMADNWLHHFNMDDQKKLDATKHIPEQIQAISDDLAERKHWYRPVTAEDWDAHAQFLKGSGIKTEDGFRMEASERFLITDRCVRCGICANVCPRNNYRLVNDRMTTRGTCDYCLACIHNCPQKAIQLRPSENPFLKPEENPNSRYRNPNVKLKDIVMANS
jgi:ferredoxin